MGLVARIADAKHLRDGPTVAPGIVLDAAFQLIEGWFWGQHVKRSVGSAIGPHAGSTLSLPAPTWLRS